jgi:hypothetical protein
VAETTIPQPTGTGTLSICHHVDFADFFFVPVNEDPLPSRATDAPATAFAT